MIADLLPLSNLLNFFSHFIVMLLLTLLFIFIYIRITPHKEFELIKAGNVAAALSLTGAMIGFVLPVGMVISRSMFVLEAVIWGSIAMLVQLIAFILVNLLIRDLPSQITANNVAVGVFFGGSAIAIGIINAACMS